MFRALVAMALVVLTGAWAGGTDATGVGGNRDMRGPSGDPEKLGKPRNEGSDHRKAAVDSIREWRLAYLRSIQNRLVQIDRELRRLVGDSLAMDTSANIQYHQVLEKARTARDHVDNIKDEMTAVRGDIPSQPWDTLQARMTLSLDALERLYLSADSADREQQQRDRRARRGEGLKGSRGGQDAGGQDARGGGGGRSEGG